MLLMANGRLYSVHSLDDMVAYANAHQNVIFFNDRESKDMVVQQYDGTVSLDQNRIYAIANYLQNQTNWETNNEWEAGSVTRPPNNVKITIDDEDEYYSLSEAWWYMLMAIKDVADGQIQYHRQDAGFRAWSLRYIKREIYSGEFLSG